MGEKKFWVPVKFREPDWGALFIVCVSAPHVCCHFPSLSVSLSSHSSSLCLCSRFSLSVALSLFLSLSHFSPSFSFSHFMVAAVWVVIWKSGPVSVWSLWSLISLQLGRMEPAPWNIPEQILDSRFSHFQRDSMPACVFFKLDLMSYGLSRTQNNVEVVII